MDVDQSRMFFKRYFKIKKNIVSTGKILESITIIFFLNIPMYVEQIYFCKQKNP